MGCNYTFVPPVIEPVMTDSYPLSVMTDSAVMQTVEYVKTRSQNLVVAHLEGKKE